MDIDQTQALPDNRRGALHRDNLVVTDLPMVSADGPEKLAVT